MTYATAGRQEVLGAPGRTQKEFVEDQLNKILEDPENFVDTSSCAATCDGTLTVLEPVWLRYVTSTAASAGKSVHTLFRAPTGGPQYMFIDAFVKTRSAFSGEGLLTRLSGTAGSSTLAYFFLSGAASAIVRPTLSTASGNSRAPWRSANDIIASGDGVAWRQTGATTTVEAHEIWVCVAPIAAATT